MQTQTRGEQGETDEWLEIQHLRKLLREKEAELRAAMVHIGFLEDHLEALRKARESELELARREIARLRVSHLSGGTP